MLTNPEYHAERIGDIIATIRRALVRVYCRIVDRHGRYIRLYATNYDSSLPSPCTTSTTSPSA